MTTDIKNIEASVKARLANKAEETGRPFAEFLQYYGMERFLYRFSKSAYASKFVLKGALMFTVWDIPERRATKDIDFLAKCDKQVTQIEKVVKAACSVKVMPDGLRFDPATVSGQKIKEDADYEGVRIKFRGFLERARIPMQIDCGFGDIVHPKPQTISYPTILDFPKPKLKGYPAETVVAEKFEAMIKLGLVNSRMKDFYDLWTMMKQFEFCGKELVEAMLKTFKHRKTELPLMPPLFAEEIYDTQSDRQELWSGFLRKTALTNAPGELRVVALEIESFLKAPIASIKSKRVFEKTWRPTDPWK